MWRNHFGRGVGPFVRQITEGNENNASDKYITSTELSKVVNLLPGSYCCFVRPRHGEGSIKLLYSG
jgi:hypothetical protein